MNREPRSKTIAVKVTELMWESLQTEAAIRHITLSTLVLGKIQSPTTEPGKESAAAKELRWAAGMIAKRCPGSHALPEMFLNMAEAFEWYGERARREDSMNDPMF